MFPNSRLVIILFVISLSIPYFVHAGFTVDLIHRDSPNSPLYNPRETHYQRLAKALRSRSSYATRSLIDKNDAWSEVHSIVGQYLMKLSFGTPPVDIYGIVDTGSDLTWMQCEPCKQCYKQTNPIFDPPSSSSFKDVHCNTPQCSLLSSTSCSTKTENICDFTYGYGGGQLAKGVLGQETIGFSSSSGQPISLENVVFGCSRNTTGGFTEEEMGLVGLGCGPVSLISQIGSAFGGKKFSHCLVPFQTHPDPKVTTKFTFGTGSEVSGEGVISTPLISSEDPTPYFVTLEGISVGDTKIPWSSPVKKGNMFLDSGTPPMIVPKDFFNQIVQEVKNVIKLQPITDDPELGDQVCYKSNSLDEIGAPILTIHFEGGSDLKLTVKSTFVSPKPNVYCFAFVPTESDGGVIGNFAQTDYLVGFDLEKKVVSFKSTDCAKYSP